MIVQRVDTEGWSVPETADAFDVSERTVHKWRARYRAEGERVWPDRSAAPHRIPHRRPPARGRIVALRAQRLAGWMIARRLRLPRATVGAVLRRRELDACPRRRPRSRCGGTNGSGPASCSGLGQVAASGRNTSHIGAMTRVAWRTSSLPTSSCSAMHGFLSAPWHSLRKRHPHGARAHRKRLGLTSRAPSRRPVRGWGSSTSGPGAHRPPRTAKPNGYPNPPARMGVSARVPHLGAASARARPVGPPLQPQKRRAHGTQLPHAAHTARGGRGVNNVPSRNN